MIILKNIWKEYKLDHELVFTALKQINLKIEKGELLSIIGPSGSGKSTLMHLIGLLDHPTRGSISFEGKDISKLSDDKISMLRNEYIGFVFQQFNLINNLTVLENILLPTIYTRKKLKYNPKENPTFYSRVFFYKSKK